MVIEDRILNPITAAVSHGQAEAKAAVEAEGAGKQPAAAEAAAVAPEQQTAK